MSVIKFKIGDKVKPKHNLEFSKKYGDWFWAESMKKAFEDSNGVATVMGISNGTSYKLDIFACAWFSDEMLDPADPVELLCASLDDVYEDDFSNASSPSLVVHKVKPKLTFL